MRILEKEFQSKICVSLTKRMVSPIDKPAKYADESSSTIPIVAGRSGILTFSPIFEMISPSFLRIFLSYRIDISSILLRSDLILKFKSSELITLLRISTLTSCHRLVGESLTCIISYFPSIVELLIEWLSIDVM